MEKSRSSHFFLFHRSFWIVFILNFFSFASHGALYHLSEYFSTLGISKSFIAFFMNIHVVGLLFVVIFLLPLIEKVGKKKIIFISYFLEFIAYVCMFFTAWNMLLLLFLRIIASFSYGVGFTVNASLAFDALPPQKRIGGIAFFGISGIVSNPFCAFLGEYVMSVFSPRGLFLLGGVLTLCALLMSIFVEEKSIMKKERTHRHVFDVVKEKMLWPEFFMGMIVGGAFATLATFVPLQTMKQFHVSFLTSYFVSYALVAILCRFFLASFFDTLSSKKLFSLGFFFVSLAMINIALIYFPIQIIFTGIFYGLGHTILYPSLSASVVKKVPEEEKYIPNSVFIGFYTLGSLFLSSLSGFVGDLTSLSGVFWVMALVSILMMFVVLKKREESNSESPLSS